jgi:amino acid permease
MQHEKKLTLLEASSIVAGLGIGGAIMAVPYLASQTGLIPIISIMSMSYFLSLILHLMITEIVLRDEEPHQLVEIFKKYLFTKTWWGVLLLWIFFSLIVLTFISLLAAYITGCAEILYNLIGMPTLAGILLTYVVAGGVVFFGLKAIGIIEKYSLIGMGLLLLVLFFGSLGLPCNSIPFLTADMKSLLALYGMVMFCFSCFFSIPQAAEGLYWNRKKVPWAVALGIGINFCFVLIVTLLTVFVSKEITKIAILGWGKTIGQWAFITGSLFVLLAMLTTFWAVSYALAVVLKEQLKWGDRLSWLVSTLPTLLLAMSGLTGFLGFMRIAGGAMAVLVAILIIPALRISRKQKNEKEPVFVLKFFGNNLFQFIIIVAYIVMVIGSMVPVK